jgi:hypothetical protein
VDIDARVAIEARRESDSVIVRSRLRVEAHAEGGDYLITAFHLPAIHLSMARAAVPVGFSDCGVSGALVARLIGDRVCGSVEATIWGTPFEISEACVYVGAAPGGEGRLQRRVW